MAPLPSLDPADCTSKKRKAEPSNGPPYDTNRQSYYLSSCDQKYSRHSNHLHRTEDPSANLRPRDRSKPIANFHRTYRYSLLEYRPKSFHLGLLKACNLWSAKSDEFPVQGRCAGRDLTQNLSLSTVGDNNPDWNFHETR
ncbi:hypothetical protein D3C87_1199660 [compost metagenome]